MYIVSFFRKDGQPTEEYYYSNEPAAQYHNSLFETDNSLLYDRIELLLSSMEYEQVIRVVYLEGNH